MGEVISLGQRRSAASAGRGPNPRVVFHFDLASPFTYLAGERVERLFPSAEWRPALADALHAGNPVADGAALERVQSAARRRAAELGLPLVWPERYPSPTPAGMRSAAFAAERGRGATFGLAAARLAFCGGFDLDDPEVLAEAAAAAGLGLDECLAAAGDLSRDGRIEAAGRRLLRAGADRLPVLRVGRTLFSGEARLDEAARAARRGADRRVSSIG